MASNSTDHKVVKMHKRPGIMVGLLLILFSVYLLFMFISSLTRDHVSIYEVTEKQISDDDTVRGIILRQETVVSSAGSGYVDYFASEGSKVSVKTDVYSLDESGDVSNQLSDTSDEKFSVSSGDTEAIRNLISSYHTDYEDANYNTPYSLQYNPNSKIQEMHNSAMLSRLSEVKKSADSSFRVYKAAQSGIIAYSSDGLEDLEMNEINADTFQDTNDALQQLRTSDKVSANTPLYRLVTDDNWSVVVPLNEEQFQLMQTQNSFSVVLKKINATVQPVCSTFTLDGHYFAKLDFRRYMVQYINNRYIDMEILINDKSGLKIPVSSIVKKKYYKIPKDCVFSEDNSSRDCVSVVTYEKGEKKFTSQVTNIIYSADEADDFCYLDADQFPAGTVISVFHSGSDTLELREVYELDGVYCCNNGYCEFRKIDIKYQNAEYCIIREDTQDGLVAYDHIVLNPETIGENDIIY